VVKEKTESPVKAREQAGKVARDVAAKFSLKGISKSAKQSIAMVNTGVKTYSILLGQTLNMRTASGEVAVQCDELGDNSVVLNVAGEQIEIFLP
jgi:hypothetical protein